MTPIKSHWTLYHATIPINLYILALHSKAVILELIAQFHRLKQVRTGMLHFKLKTYEFTKHKLFWKGISKILTRNLIKFHRASLLRIMRSNCFQCELVRWKSVKNCCKFRLSASQNVSDFSLKCCLILYPLKSNCECYKSCWKIMFENVLCCMKTFRIRSCLFSVNKTFYSI